MRAQLPLFCLFAALFVGCVAPRTGLVGSWKVVERDGAEVPDPPHEYFSFRENGTYSRRCRLKGSGTDHSHSGYYTVSEGTISVLANKENQPWLDAPHWAAFYEVDGNELRLQFTNPAGKSAVCKRLIR